MTRTGDILVSEPCFSSASFRCPDAFETSTTKTEVFNGKRLRQILATNALARFRIVTYCYATSFSRKTILCKTNNVFYSLGGTEN